MKLIQYDESFVQLIDNDMFHEKSPPFPMLANNSEDVVTVLGIENQTCVAYFILEKLTDCTTRLHTITIVPQSDYDAYMTKTLQQLPAFLRTLWPKTQHIETAIDKKRHDTIQRYRQYGFIDTFIDVIDGETEQTILQYDLRELTIQYFTTADFSTLTQWLTNETDIALWGGDSFTYPLTTEQLTKYIRNANHYLAERYVFKVLYQGDVIGHISITQIDRKNDSARIERVLIGDPVLRGQRLGERMMRQTLNFCFKQLKLHRVTLGVYDFNEAAFQCYEKVGFRKEGHLRDTLKVNGTFWSMYEMSMIDHEWIIV